mmetsp:Transcript_1560/g.1749  ORF Transcript_1560/g.1749 Transcript_1560/m.1749 type:complete len:381 (+) Transcript_1560:35-1177(+)
MRAVIGLLLVFFCVSQGQLLSNVTKIIQSEGYPAEIHKVQTEDGYILTINRVPHGKASTDAPKGAVFFQHGLTDSAFGGVCNPPPEGLAYFFADAGFDVWLGNNRGNGISMEHIKYTPSDVEFWDFTYDDMAQYDLPAQLDYIIKHTGQEKIPYIGHSQGTIQAFAGFLDPSVAAKASIFIAMAPVAWVKHIDVTIMKVLAAIDTATLGELLGIHEVYLPSLIHKLTPYLCELDPESCEFTMIAATGDFTYKNKTQFPFYVLNEPFPTSVKNLIHWSQGIRENVFQKFDYGDIGNLERYHQLRPPAYDLKKFPTTLPVALFTGSIDALADPEDVKQIVENLPTKPFIHNEPTFGHLDFTLGYLANKRVYSLALKLIEANR